MSTAPTRPYANPIDVAEELESVGIDALQFDESRYRTWLKRAVKVLDTRLPDERDVEHLTDLEILVAAHFAYPASTSHEGQRLSSITQESAQISFDNSKSTSNSNPPGEYESPFWDQAVLLDHRLSEDPGDWWAVTVGGRGP